MAAQFVEFADCVIVKPLELLELGESTADISLEPSTPAMPEPELEATKLERVRSQLTQRDPNGAAARVAIAEKRARGEIVGVIS